MAEVFVRLLQGLGTASACAILGPAGGVLNPLLGTLAAWAGKSVDGDYKNLADGAGGVLSNVLSNLATNNAQQLLDRMRGGDGNGDLERAAAAAIRAGLQYSRRQFQRPDQTILGRAYDNWFDIWDARLKRAIDEKDEESLFLAGVASDPIPTEESAWWSGFEGVLLRWAHEQALWESREIQEFQELPNPFRQHLKKNLRSEVNEAYHLVLREDNQKRAWIAWQQKFLVHIADQTANTNLQVSHCFQDLAGRIEELIPYMDRQFAHVDTRFDEVIAEIRRKPEIPLTSAGQKRKSNPCHESAKGPASDLPLLSPFADIVPYQGREHDLQRMLQWLDSSAAISIRTIIGRAGAGKTRFAMELLKRLESRTPGTWHTGFLSSNDLRSAKGEGIVHRSRPTFIIIDYASAVSLDLREWLESIADHDESPHPLRILFLDRDASASQGWLNTLQTNSRLQAFFGDPEPFPLPPIESGTQRRIILNNTLLAAANRRGVPCPELPPDGNPEFEKRLNQPTFNDPLYLQMAALSAFDGIALVLDLLLLSRTDLAEHMARMEAERIPKFCHDRNPSGERLLIHMAAYSTLVGGIAVDELTEIVASEARALHNSYDVWQCSNELLNALPEDKRGDRVAAIQPDIVGEAFVLRSFSAANRSAGDKLILRLREKAVPALIRIAQDFAFAEELQHHSPVAAMHTSLSWLDKLIDTKDPLMLSGIESAMPEQTVALRESRVKVLQLKRKLLKESKLPDLAELARVVNNLGNDLSRVGRREEALAAAEEAVTIRRELAAERPEVFLPDLAMSLNNVGNRRIDMGRREEALAAADEALGLYRKLAAERRDAFLRDLAMSLNNVALIRSEMGRRGEGLAAAEEAVTIRREMVSEKPDVFLPDLATSLNTVANMRSDMGRRDGALAAAEEALELYRKLAAEKPDAFLPNLAASLNTVTTSRRGVGSGDKALAAAEEALVVYRKLAAERPDEFLPYLTISLNNLALMRTEMGNMEGSLAVAEEAVGHYRKLAAESPAAFQSQLAASLNNLAKSRSDVGRMEEAHAAAEEAVIIRRELAAERPDALLPDLAKSLNNVALFRTEMGKREEALAAAEEALVLYRKLMAEWPDVFRPDLAASLNNLTKSRSDVGRMEEALAAAEEALVLYRKLAAEWPDAFRPNLAASLNNVANTRSDVGRMEEALAAAEEAMLLYRKLATERPDAFLPDLAMSLNKAASMWSDVGKRKEALSAAEETVAIRRKLAAERPNVFLRDLARALAFLSINLTSNNETNRAHDCIKEAVATLSPLFVKCTGSFQSLMIQMLRDYIAACEAANIDPDETLLTPILQKLQPSEET